METISEVITRAEARERELLKELQDLKVFLEVYRKLSGDTSPVGVVAKPPPDSLDSTVTNGPSPNGGLFYPEPEPVSKTHSGMRQVDFVPFVRTMILEHGRPMQPAEILKGFKKRGRRVGGALESENLKSKLWRAKEQIINIGGSGYWPIDVACPQVSYVPPDKEAED